MISRKKFNSIFTGSFWKKTRESIVPFVVDNPDKKIFLRELYRDLKNKEYYPSLPREYIVFDKHNYVSRIVPTFELRDSCAYFLCVKELEKYIATNRVKGTFGGWSLGNPIKDKEDVEISDLENEQARLSEVPSGIPNGTYNPRKWAENWKEFQKRAYQFSKRGKYRCFLKFDISNFYDSINLRILENKVRLACPKRQSETIDLLFHFLHNWNRQLEKYSEKTVGIPQDDIGDCSRILANFYLQDYDTFIKRECEKRSALYLRYADDQIIFAKNEKVAKEILFEASKELFKINLNVNSAKVQIFSSKTEFNKYWAFDLFNQLADLKNKKKVNKAIKIFLDRSENKVSFREFSVLKRILQIDPQIITPHLKHRLLANFLDPNFLATQDYWVFRKLLESFFVGDEKNFFKILDKQINTLRFNSFHYNLLKFYKKHRKDFDTTKLQKRIKELQLVMK